MNSPRFGERVFGNCDGCGERRRLTQTDGAQAYCRACRRVEAEEPESQNKREVTL